MTYDHNLDQQVGNVSRPDGDYITPSYDSVKGRLTAVTTGRGTSTYGYSPTTGLLTNIMTFDGIGLTYAYDGSLLKDITWSGPVSGNVHKTYDSSFRLSSESVTGGQSINFGYDNDDLLTSAGAMTVTRDPTTGFVTGTALGAISESRTYDAYGAEQTYSVTANGTTLYGVDYGTRDALGRIVNKSETVQGETHVYGYTAHHRSDRERAVRREYCYRRGGRAHRLGRIRERLGGYWARIPAVRICRWTPRSGHGTGEIRCTGL